MNVSRGRLTFASRAALVAVCLFSLSGCREHGSTADDHDDDHAGHVIPEHKPKSFPQAIHRLRELNERIASDVASGNRDAKTLSMALDIANWLPEIAADSDMPEQPWNEVNANAARVAADLQTVRSNPASAQAALADAGTRIAALEALLSKADPRWFDDMKNHDPITAK